MRKSEFLTTTELAKRWRISAQGIAMMRARGGGPPFVRLGRKILYRREDIEEFEEGNTLNSTSEYG